MGGKYITLSHERHDRVFRIYEEVVKSYGVAARYMLRTHFYHEVAARTSYSWYTVAKIIRSKLKENSELSESHRAR